MRFPREGDVIMDPFAGSGSIVAAASSLPHSRLICSDMDGELGRSLAEDNRLGRFGHECQVLQLDFGDHIATVRAIGSHVVDHVVTDPPWGIYGANVCPLEDLYALIVTTLEEILVSDGRVTMLTARPDIARQSLHDHMFNILEDLPVLVKGKKACVIHATMQA